MGERAGGHGAAETAGRLAVAGMAAGGEVAVEAADVVQVEGNGSEGDVGWEGGEIGCPGMATVKHSIQVRRRLPQTA